MVSTVSEKEVLKSPVAISISGLLSKNHFKINENKFCFRKM